MNYGQDTIDYSESSIEKLRIELNKKSIDNFFVIQHIQYGTVKISRVNDNDYCDKQQTYYRMYAFWKEKNSYWMKAFDNCGGFVPIEVKQNDLINIYTENFDRIKIEEVQIYKRKPDSLASNGKIYSFVSSRSHSPLRYFWFYKGDVLLKKHLDTYDLTTDGKSPNINHETNNKLFIVKLNEISEAIIEEYDKKAILVREK